MSDKLFLLQSQKKSTSHVLHLILSVITGGLWLIVWFCVAMSNKSHNNRIQGDMNRFFSYKAQGMSDAEAYQQEARDTAEKKKLQMRAFIVIAALVFVLYLINH